MTVVKKEINGSEYMFINSWRGNRSGFVHETQLFKNSQPIGDAKIQYYNRTWECYEYQTVMKRLVGELMETCEEIFQNAWKNAHNIKRLTQAKRDEMWEEMRINPPENYQELTELYSML